MGVDPKKRARDFRAYGHHVVGNGMRLDSTAEVQLDERWKSALSPTELGAFDVTAGRANRRYGYAALFSNEKA